MVSKIFSKIYQGEIERAKWSRNAFHHSLLFNSKYNSSISSGKWAGLTYFFFVWLHTPVRTNRSARFHSFPKLLHSTASVRKTIRKIDVPNLVHLPLDWYTLLLVLKKTHNFTGFIIAHSYYTGILFQWHENKNPSGCVCSEKV